MIRQLLAGLDDSEFSEAATRFACDLARIHGARVLGLAVANTKAIEEAYHTLRPLGAGSADSKFYQESLEEARDKAESNLGRFVKICQEQKVEHKAIKVEGDPAEEILKAASISDLVVLGRRTEFTCGLSEDQYCDASMEVLDNSVRPLMLIPSWHRQIKRVMIAMDLQRLSDRLFYTYSHLNPYPEAEVHLVHVTDPEDKDKKVPAEIVEFFGIHQIKVKPKVLHGEHTGQAIVNYVDTEGIDMLVMGIHNISKLWKSLLGSTGRYVIQNLEIPICTQT